MKIEQRQWTEALRWRPTEATSTAASAQLVFVFGATAVLQQADLIAAVRQYYPLANIFGCSTAGEICSSRVSDDSLVATAICFEHSQLSCVYGHLADAAGSFTAGEALGRQLPRSVMNEATGDEAPLVHVLVLAEGLDINGSEFVEGLTQQLPRGVNLTGGLAGDGTRFGETLVFHEGVPCKRAVAALGLYGSRLQIGYGSLGGWDAFGPERLITKSTGNVLYELDERPALGLYKQYLGEHAAGLPATGLQFPLSIRTDDSEKAVVRTILAVDEDAQSLTFAGDIPEGAYARLMKANLDRLIDGAAGAARASGPPSESGVPDLALLISCVGRKLVLRQRAEDEVEAVRAVLGSGAALAGFYSFGEISPFAPGAACELHNQTMTVTTFAER